MRLRIFGPILHRPKARHAHIVERFVIRAALPKHRRFPQFQFMQRGDDLVRNFAVLIIVVQSEGKYAAGAGIVHQHA